MAMPSAEVGIRERLNNDQNPTEPLLGTGQPDLVPPKFSLVRAQLWCILLNFLIEFFDMVIIVPQLVLFERSLCYSYYRLHEKDGVGPRGIVEERSCKIERIQQELAVLRGWKALFDALPGQQGVGWIYQFSLTRSKSLSSPFLSEQLLI